MDLVVAVPIVLMYVVVAVITFDLTAVEIRDASIWHYVGAAIWPLTWLLRLAAAMILPRPPS